MKEITYSYFIISCKRNIDIVTLCVEQLLVKTSVGKIYVSFDKKCDMSFNNDRVIILDNYSEKYSCFGDRIQHSLRFVPEKYVIVLCDDFIVECNVDELILKKIQNYMFRNKFISAIALASTSSKKTDDCIFGYYYRCAKYTNYKVTLQCSFWNKNALNNLMKDIKSPWEFEIFSNYRTFSSCNIFYALINDEYQPIKYNRGSFVIRGKIVEPERVRLEKVLNKKINIKGFDIVNSYQQVSTLSILDKVIRRLKMLLKSFKYRIKSFYREYDLNDEMKK